MRVAFDSRIIADHYPGIGRYAFGLARALGKLADLTLLIDPEAANTRHNLEAIPAKRISVAGGPFSLAAQWRVPAAVTQSGAAIYHSPHFLMPFATPLLARGVQPVVTFYDLIPLMPEAGYSPQARLTIRLAHWLAGRVARRVIVLSSWAAQSVAQTLRLNPARVAVVPPGVGEAFQPASPQAVEALRSRLGLPDCYLLYVGTQRPHKNLARLVKAIASLPRSTPPLIIAGPSDPRFPEPEAEAQRLGLEKRVKFLGAMAEADLPALYTGAELLVAPSLAEGFGLPILEAMACCVPVACSTAAGLNEAAGEAALRFDPLSIESIAETIKRVSEDDALRREMRQKSLQHAASFSWEKAAQQTLAGYRSIEFREKMSP